MNQVKLFEASKALIIKVGQQEYGIDIIQVVSIERMQAITPYPNRPKHVLGVVHIRNLVIPVVDLCSALSGQQSNPNDFMRIVIVRVHHKEIGIIVGAATDVLDIDSKSIQNANLMEDREANYLMGITELEDHLVILLDIEKLLEDVTNLDELREMIESFKEENGLFISEREM